MPASGRVKRDEFEIPDRGRAGISSNGSVVEHRTGGDLRAESAVRINAEAMIVNDPEATFLRGVDRLRPVLESAGFEFAVTEKGQGSGGAFIRGQFTKGERRLSLSYRQSLGLVTYAVGPDMLTHEDYMWAAGRLGEYPGFSPDELAPFEHLRADLESAGQAFLVQPPAEFAALAEKCREHPPKRGFDALGESR